MPIPLYITYQQNTMRLCILKLFLLHSPVFTLVTVIITVHVSFHLLVAGVQLDSHAPLPLDVHDYATCLHMYMYHMS